ncbi:protein PEP-RELATED DEVELOPMENT ARRESTED 1, chloroplastic [Prunus avium]|uniref:Protein PEP-RELATED DEVELOPMENT ARRESTED 1, chloroplastic n=1 Tax=Prunus avium TaxID=42229 RepID=A0A6P5SK64_PRUAV|nr:protein PEP-RELATED DEVELOPMENT ARRESTED 1, chloroplastic [Prunus avium]XP_021816469.1 protein PEP-RELATED DEVELOPMENT ARRESTED 1, chloroplastic [Prunus avium]
MLRSSNMFPSCSYPSAQTLNPTINSPSLLSFPSFSFTTVCSRHNNLPQPQFQAKQPNKKKKRQMLRFCGTYEVGGGYPDEELGGQEKSRTTQEHGNSKLDTAQYEALLKGGDQVTSVLEEMITLLEDMNMDEASEEVAVEIAAQGVLGKRVDEMESGFMMALDYMIQLAENDQDDKRKSLLEVIKETVLSYLTKKCPPHVQVVGLLCRTPQKESRQELLRRVAAGGGVFKSKNDIKVHVPAANLNDIANQADDILETMETRPVVPDRKLLARLVLIREEARNMMGGGLLDERNDRGFNTLPESEVNFLTKLVALKPGKTVQEMIKNVMEGKNEGADDASSDEEDTTGRASGIAGRESVTGRKALPVRPGMFLETVSKVLGGIYAGNLSGITAQHLEWVHQKTLEVLQEIAF